MFMDVTCKKIRCMWDTVQQCMSEEATRSSSESQEPVVRQGTSLEMGGMADAWHQQQLWGNAQAGGSEGSMKLIIT